MRASNPLAVLWAVALLVVLPAEGPQAAEETLEGPVEVVDGDTLVVGGRELDLAGIDAPESGQLCRRANKTFDCGRIAATALMDLTAGAQALCHLQEATAECTVDGFDLSQNMVHTGWALAQSTAPLRLHAVQRKARAAKRGLWLSVFVDPARWRAGDRLR